MTIRIQFFFFFLSSASTTLTSRTIFRLLLTETRAALLIRGEDHILLVFLISCFFCLSLRFQVTLRVRRRDASPTAPVSASLAVRDVIEKEPNQRESRIHICIRACIYVYITAPCALQNARTGEHQLWPNYIVATCTVSLHQSIFLHLFKSFSLSSTEKSFPIVINFFFFRFSFLRNTKKLDGKKNFDGEKRRTRTLTRAHAHAERGKRVVGYLAPRDLVSEWRVSKHEPKSRNGS